MGCPSQQCHTVSPAALGHYSWTRDLGYWATGGSTREYLAPPLFELVSWHEPEIRRLDREGMVFKRLPMIPDVVTSRSVLTVPSRGRLLPILR